MIDLPSVRPSRHVTTLRETIARTLLPDTLMIETNWAQALMFLEGGEESGALSCPQRQDHLGAGWQAMGGRHRRGLRGIPQGGPVCWWSEELCGTAPDAIDLRLGALGELLRKQEKLVAPAGAVPPRQADLSRRTIRLQRSGNERGSHQHAGIDREFRQKRGAESVVDHLYQRLQTGCFERVTVPAIGETAGGERVLAQAMPVLEQQQILGQMLRVDIALLDQRMLGRQCRQQRIVEQDDRLSCAAVVGQRQQEEVELALVQRIDQARRQVLDQIKLEPGIGATQVRQHARQQEWADSRDRAHSQRAAKRLPPSAGGTRKLLKIHNDLAGTLDRVEAKRGQHDVALGAVDQRRLEHVLELLDAGAQGRLGHAAGLGSATEMAMVGERHQVAQMPYRRQMLHAIASNRGGGCPASREIHQSFMPLSVMALTSCV